MSATSIQQRHDSCAKLRDPHSGRALIVMFSALIVSTPKSIAISSGIIAFLS